MHGRTSSRSLVPHLLLALICSAWVAGVAAASAFSDAWLLAPALLAALLALAVARRSPPVAAYALLLPAVLLAGIAWEHRSRDTPAADAIAQYNEGPAMRMIAVLRDDPEIGDTSQRFITDVRSVQINGQWRDASGAALVRAPLLPRYEAGDMLELEGALAAPRDVAGFDYAAYLARRGIASVMEYPQSRLVGHEAPPWWQRAALTARRRLSHGIELAVPEPQASLAQGVLLGERSLLPRDVSADLNATNTSHLVVVSGSNIVLVATYSTLLLGGLFGRRRARWLSIGIVLAYAMLAGASPPVLRATAMGVLLVMAGATGRRSGASTSLALAAAVMCAVDPDVLRDVSFQLSFAATAGILWLASPLRRRIIDALSWLLRRERVPRWCGWLIAEPLAVTLAATFATAPVLAHTFGRASLVGLPANMLIVPVFPLMLAASMLAALGGLLPFGHVAAGAPAQALFSYWLAVSDWLAALPAASPSLRGYSLEWMLASYGALATVLILLERQLTAPARALLAESHPFRWRIAARRAAYVLPAACVLASVGWIAQGSRDARLEVTVLDVGQGDAILIETPAGRDVLVDGGPGRAVLRGLGDELAWHDRSLDLVVLTHPQSDHALGLLDVFARYDVERVLRSESSEPSLVAAAVDSAVHREGAQIDTAVAGHSYDLGDGVRLDVLSPAPGAAVSENNASIVLRLTWGDVSFLLTGDIEAPAEEALLASGVDLRATVLKVAHHGSATSSTAAFLDAARPSVAVVSAGRDNRFGHPAPEAVERLTETGAQLLVTAEDGNVTIETDGQRVWVSSER